MTLSRDQVTVTGGKSHRTNSSADNQVAKWELMVCVITEMKHGESGQFRFFRLSQVRPAVGTPGVILYPRIIDTPVEASRPLLLANPYVPIPEFSP